jgi:hypothetical protein
MTPKPFKRTGLHRLECEAVRCDGYVYATVAELETRGLPSCGCGAAFVPARLELALLLGVDAPVVAEYQAELESVALGQSRRYGAGHALGMLGKTPDDPSVKASARLEQRRRQDARERRLIGLRIGPAPARDPEPIPF